MRTFFIIIGIWFAISAVVALSGIGKLLRLRADEHYPLIHDNEDTQS